MTAIALALISYVFFKQNTGIKTDYLEKIVLRNPPKESWCAYFVWINPQDDFSSSHYSP